MTYSCDPGYIMSDSANSLVTCLSTGQWSAPPSCQSELASYFPEGHLYMWYLAYSTCRRRRLNILDHDIIIATVMKFCMYMYV